MGRRKPLNVEEKEEICSLYKRGFSPKQIADKFNICQNSINDVIRKGILNKSLYIINPQTLDEAKTVIKIKDREIISQNRKIEKLVNELLEHKEACSYLRREVIKLKKLVKKIKI